MKKLFYLLLILLVTTIAVTLLPVNKHYGYSKMVPVCNQSNWIYRQIFESPEPLAVAFIGSTHTMLGVQDSILTTLNEHVGGKGLILNLGFCEYGRSLHYVLIKDLIENRKPKAIVLEVRTFEDLSSHRDFPRLADGVEVLFPGSIVNSDYFGDVFKAFGTRVGGWVSSPSTSWHGDQRWGYRYSDNLSDTMHLNTRAAHERGRTAARRSEGWMYRLSNRYPEAYLRMIADLTEEHGLELYFLYLPSFAYRGERPEREDLYRELGQFLHPPDSVLLPADHWSDMLHLNRRGAEAMAGWLAQEKTGLAKSK